MRFLTSKLPLNHMPLCAAPFFPSQLAVTSFPYPIRYILDAREMPVLSMLEKIRCQIMNRIYTKQHEARDKWTGTICPKVKKKLDRHIEVAASCMVYPAGGGIFSVSDKYGSNIVDINVRSCDCRWWRLMGTPCCHAIAYFRHDEISPETMVHECYSIETYMQSYGYNIWPVRDKIHWEKMNGVDV